MPERARTDPWEPQGSNPLGPPGPEFIGLLQNAIEPPQNGEWQDHLAVFGLLVVAAEQVSHGPDEGGEVGSVHESKSCKIVPGIILRKHQILPWPGYRSKREHATST